MKHLLLAVAIILMMSLSAVNHMDLMTTITGEFNGSSMGWSVISLDFNGDGIKDLVTYSFDWNPTGVYNEYQANGKLYFYMGGTNFDNVPEYTLTGTFNRQYCGAIINAGDINGDGKEDIAMMTLEREIPPDNNEAFSLYVFYGRDTPQATPDYTMNIDYDPIINIWLNPLGDINNDHCDDLSLSYSSNNRNYFDCYILLGGSYGMVSFIENHLTNRGLFLDGIGDINHDGIDDFHLYCPTSASNDGDPRLTVYYGSTAFPECDSVIICEDTHRVNGPEACAVGDVNGDGIADFVSDIALPAHLWYGGANITSTWDVDMEGGLYGGNGTSPGLIYGDLNNDGIDDIIGSDSRELMNNGRAGVWMGRTVFNGTLDLTISSPGIDQQFGWAKAAGDFNNDGFCDVAITAPFIVGTPTTPGYVYVYSGNADLADTTVENDDSVIPMPDTAMYALEAYPNPLKNNASTLNISFKGAGYKSLKQAKLIISNAKGQTVYSADLSGKQLRNGWANKKIRKLAAGTYIVTIKANNNVLTSTKITIIRP